ncbi:Uncharacterised protein [Mycobacterium tuberculosis]|nr:Uncharacterised protein [Mycobacterium tuberculosis]
MFSFASARCRVCGVIQSSSLMLIRYASCRLSTRVSMRDLASGGKWRCT